MSPDTGQLVIIGAFHLIVLGLGAALFLLLVRSENTATPPDDDDDSGGGNDRTGDPPKTSPSGGPPLPYAVQSERRLRCAHDRLTDPRRRRVRAPAERRPVRSPARTAASP